MATCQGVLITALLMACVVDLSAGQNQTIRTIPKIPQSQAWSYQQFTDVTGTAILIANLESAEGMHIAIEQHPRFGTSAYIFFLFDGKVFDCEKSCVINIRFDDEKLEPWPVLGARGYPSVGLSLAQVEELITRLKDSHHFTIEAPVLASGRASFDFFSGGIIWPPPPALVVIAEGTALAERHGLRAGGKNRWPPLPACYYMPYPPIPKGTVPADFHGTVDAEAKVTVEGRIENIKILKSLSPALNESVIETLKTWKCKPATVPPNSEPIPVTVSFQIKF